MHRILAAMLMVGCAQVEGWIDSKGTVYSCGGTIEYCYLDDSADELSEMVGRECHPITPHERFGPWLLDCWYHCDNPSTPDVNEGAGNGCNAHGGCWCE